jgi:hypothetical protein
LRTLVEVINSAAATENLSDITRKKAEKKAVWLAKKAARKAAEESLNG